MSFKVLYVLYTESTSLLTYIKNILVKANITSLLKCHRSGTSLLLGSLPASSCLAPLFVSGCVHSKVLPGKSFMCWGEGSSWGGEGNPHCSVFWSRQQWAGPGIGEESLQFSHCTRPAVCLARISFFFFCLELVLYLSVQPFWATSVKILELKSLWDQKMLMLSFGSLDRTDNPLPIKMMPYLTLAVQPAQEQQQRLQWRCLEEVWRYGVCRRTVKARMEER